MEARANVYCKTNDDETPRDLAEESETIALLDAAMAKAEERCRAAAVAVMAIYRGRGVDRHLLALMGRMVWDTRELVEWQR